jgi:hypothetical protein
MSNVRVVHVPGASSLMGTRPPPLEDEDEEDDDDELVVPPVAQSNWPAASLQ